MESFYRTHAYLVEHTNAPVRRDLMDEIDWSDRLIGIKGTRGVGKTTFLLQYAKEKFGTDRSCLFINMNNFYFSGHSIVDFANEFQKRGGKVLLINFAHVSLVQVTGEVLLKNGQIIFCSRRRRRETREAFLVYAGAGKFSHETI